MDFAFPADHRVKIKESEKRDKYLDLARKLKQSMEYEDDDDANSNWWTWNDSQRLSKRAGAVGNRRMSVDYPNYRIVEVGQNTEKSPRNLRRLVTQRTRKLMTMYKALHPRDVVVRLYVSRKEGGRRLARIEYSIDTSIQRLEDYI